MELLRVCPVCPSQNSDVQVVEILGAYTKYKTRCTECRYEREWSNSPVINKIPILNLLISFMILFSGSLPTKFLRALSQLRVFVPSTQTFQRYQKDFLHGVNIFKTLLKA